MAAATYTDTSSSGTVACGYTDLFGVSTIAASATTTFTNYFGSYFREPVASTNVTFTNKFAMGADSLRVGTASELRVTSTGNIGLFGVTPVAQPTTSIATSLRVPGFGATIKIDDTYDGYTLLQVVTALRNLGIMA